MCVRVNYIMIIIVSNNMYKEKKYLQSEINYSFYQKYCVNFTRHVYIDFMHAHWK